MNALSPMLHPRVRWLPLVLLGLAPLAAAQLPERGADALAQAFLDARARTTSPEVLAEDLASGGSSSIPALVQLLTRGRFDVRIGERGNSTRALLPKERVALIAAFEHLPWDATRGHLEELLEAEPSELQRLASLQILGAHGTSRDFPALLEWSDPPAGERRVSREVRAGFGAALGALLDQHPNAMRSVPGLYRGAHMSLLPSVARALGERPTEESLAALVTVLGHTPEADAFLLAEIGHTCGALRYPANDEARHAVRAYLFNHDDTRLLESIVALGQIEDAASVPDLIELLEHDNASVRERAHVSLRRISGGETMSARPELWRDWHRESADWWRDRAPDQLRRVADASPGIATRALLDLSKRRFFRHDLADEVALALRRPEKELVILTCATLGHLGSTRGVPHLLELLFDQNVDVRRAAYLALGRITGEDHGELAEDWTAAGW